LLKGCAVVRIAQFTNAYMPVISGVVRSVSLFRKALNDLGHIVFVFAQENNYEDDEPFIFRYPSLPLPLQQVDVSAAIPVSPFMDRLFPALKPEVVHTHHPVLLGQAAASKAREYELPLVFTFHTQYREYTHYVPLPQEAVQNFLRDAVDNWLRDYMRKCQHIVVPSQSMLDILVREYGLRSRYTIIPTGIDLGPFRDADGELLRAEKGWETEWVMISIGRLAQEKNWRTLLKATALVIQDYPVLRLVILGDGPERNNLQHFSSKLGISDNVSFIGEVPFDQVPKYLKAADFFGFASTSETQGLVTLEALSAGLPVIAVNGTGTRDILEHDRQGKLVDDNPHALAGAIRGLLEEEGLIGRFQAAALERAKEFDIHVLAKRMVDVYLQAIEDKLARLFVEIE
jgi:glycosyltransferase involved in cell wall biosynthesis